MGDKLLEAGFAEMRGEAQVWENEACAIESINSSLGNVENAMSAPLIDGLEAFKNEYLKVCSRFKELGGLAPSAFRSVGSALNSTASELEKLDNDLGDGMAAIW